VKAISFVPKRLNLSRTHRLY